MNWRRQKELIDELRCLPLYVCVYDGRKRLLSNGPSGGRGWGELGDRGVGKAYTFCEFFGKGLFGRLRLIYCVFFAFVFYFCLCVVSLVVRLRGFLGWHGMESAFCISLSVTFGERANLFPPPGPSRQAFEEIPRLKGRRERTIVHFFL